jgi:hypothetical protein
MTLNVNTLTAGYAGDEDGDDVSCMECAKSVTRRDGTVGRDDYDPHSEPLPTDEECERMWQDYKALRWV